jgi:hypothetical protein
MNCRELIGGFFEEKFKVQTGRIPLHLRIEI